MLSRSRKPLFSSDKSIPSNSSTDNKSDFSANMQRRFQLISFSNEDYALISFRKTLYPIALHISHSDYHFLKLPLPPFVLLPRYATTGYMYVIDPSLVSIFDWFGVLLLPPCCAPLVPKQWLTLVIPLNHMHKLRLKETEWTIEWITWWEGIRIQLFADSVGEYKQLEDDDLHHLTGWGTTTASSPRLLDNKHNQNRHAGRKPIP